VNENGIPVAWVKKMRESMKSIGPAFSARRMIKEYSQKFYQPALAAAED
jgi:starch phosphorylase